MNRSIVRYILFKVIEFEAIFLGFACIVALIYHEREGLAYAAVALFCGIIGVIGTRKKPQNLTFFAKEGFVAVALSWIVLGVIGALPFWLCGDIPRYIDALFETISGFTTTGASILEDVEILSRCSLFWRSFTHWIGGMGVLVFILAVLPMADGNEIHIMRAESPGPSVGKLVPRVKQTAMILYIIYFAMTIVEMILLLISGMPLFDTITLSFGTAGTGGFGILNSSVGSYSMASQSIITIFMILFGVNFSAYYFILMKKWKQALSFEEVRWYFIIIAASALIIAVNIRGYYDTFIECFHHSVFQVASIMTTTGFSTGDFDKWPSLSKGILVLLMFIGACAGSTGGGLKVSRIIAYCKIVKNEILFVIHPRRVRPLQLEGHSVSSDVSRGIPVYLAAFLLIFTASTLLISFDNKDLVTNFTAVAATINNIGPGLSVVGPTGNFSSYSDFSNVIFIFDMLIGRLEIFPLLVLLAPSTWRKGA
ncbi:MAG: TrkH family potassium uptake protein [Clostridia bacterium]|nr:TrkH family potassium uptake protein [Clostridia bacterium]